MANKPNPADFSPTVPDFPVIGQYQPIYGKFDLTTYIQGASDYEIMSFLVQCYNATLKGYSDVTQLSKDTVTAYNQLQTWVNTWFDNLDVQQEINNKLQSMYEAGTLSTAIAQSNTIPPAVAQYLNSTEGTQNLSNVTAQKIEAMAASGALGTVINNAGAVQSTTTNWLQQNVTPTGSAVMVDKSLSVEGAAADSKKTGFGVNSAFVDDKLWLSANGFVRGNYDVSANSIDDGLQWCFRDVNFYPVKSNKFSVSIEDGYRLYIVKINVDQSFERVHNSTGGEYFENGYVSEETDAKRISFVVTKNDMSVLPDNAISLAKPRISGVYEIPRLSNDTVGYKGKKLFKDANPVTVYEKQGEGILQNMFFAGDFPEATTRIYITIDGSLRCVGYLYELAGLWISNENTFMFGNSLFGKTGTKGGIYLNYKFPFYKSIKIQLQNPSAIGQYVWFSCRTTDWYPFTIGGISIPYGAYLEMHSQLFQNVASGSEITLLDLKKQYGCLLCTLMQSKGATSSWYMEGMFREYFGDSTEPKLLSTGMEDYFLGTYYFETGTYTNEVSGCTSINDLGGANSFAGYRLHTNDAVPFPYNSYKLTLRNNDLNTEDATSLQSETYADYRIIVGYYSWA